MSFFWDGTNWQYKKKDSLPGNITLPDKDGNLYTVSREGPSIERCHPYLSNISTQINNTKCDKISYLNAFNTLLYLPCLIEWLLPNLQRNSGTKQFIQLFELHVMLPVW